MTDVPGPQELQGSRPLAVVELDVAAADAYPVPERDARVPVLAHDPRVDRRRGDAAYVRDAASKPQVVVERVSDDAPAVDSRPLLRPRHERVDGVHDDHEHALPARGQRVHDGAEDPGIVLQVDESRLVHRERHGGGDHEDVRVDGIGRVARTDARPAPLRENLLEIHHVRDHHFRPPVGDHDVVAADEQQVERDGCTHATRTADDRDLHRALPRGNPCTRHRPALNQNGTTRRRADHSRHGSRRPPRSRC